jgi:IS605 OrfB family transposase
MSKDSPVILTRRIQIIPNYNSDEKDSFNEVYQTLHRWRSIVFKSANMISSHLFIQEQVKDLIYFTEDFKVKLTDIKKDENGILSTSKQNSTYQLLSKQFKGDIPTSILTALNSNITSSFNKNKKHYFKGERSLMNYKNSIPIPFQASSMREIIKGPKKDYSFSLFGLKFKTFFGKDLSRNEIIFDRAIQGEYKLCDSSIIIKDKKIFLLAVFEFTKELVKLEKDIVCEATLDINHPIIVKIGKKTFNIGDKDEFLHRRIAIQAGLRRCQIAATYNKGGRGIQKKIASINKFKEAEINYVNSRIHKYSARLIDLCVKEKAGIIQLNNISEVKESTKEDELLLRNWSYFGLIEKIKYKSNRFNIEVVEL